MDHSRAPLLEALTQYHELDRYGFTPPGHRQGVARIHAFRQVLGIEPFRDDVLASSGLDDRSSSSGYLKHAEQLMADAAGADNAFFQPAAVRCRSRPRCWRSPVGAGIFCSDEMRISRS